MEGSDGSPPPSLHMIRAEELYPKPQTEKEDVDLKPPFQELAGEYTKYIGRTDDGVLALSNFRISLQKHSTNSETSVPLGLIESVQIRDLFHLTVNCKDASTVKCSFETAEQCADWQRRLHLSIGVPETLESLFAFPFCLWTCDRLPNGAVTTQNGGGLLENQGIDYLDRFQRALRYDEGFEREVERLGFDLKGSWRISLANQDFKLCSSYPQKLLVPQCIADDILNEVANFRGSRRLPAVVWRHRKSGAVIARCSQPEVGWLGWRNHKDELLLQALADACATDSGEQNRRLIVGQNDDCTSTACADEKQPMDEEKKILIVDARSYTSAVTNRARGGGCECIEYYPCAEIEFMNLGNIHAIRKSFHSLRSLCASSPDNSNWLSSLEKTMWLQHLSGLLAASMTVCHAIEKQGRPVVVHCSDGWDRTPQIVATAELCLDPYYRTIEGFRVLVEREWLNFGHKFADRCGHGPGSDELNERCPVFLQWLDLVHQIHEQYSCSFEFNMGYLVKLVQHSFSCLFGTFLCNTLKDRLDNTVFERTFSVWPFLSDPIYRNPLYVRNREVLWPVHKVRDLKLWTEVYMGSLGNQNCIDYPLSHGDDLSGLSSSMSKTRSYDDLSAVGHTSSGISRRSSDPNMSVDSKLTLDSNTEKKVCIDSHSEREDSPDNYANIIQDTTKKLQDLTINLNNHDEEKNYDHQMNNKDEQYNEECIINYERTTSNDDDDESLKSATILSEPLLLIANSSTTYSTNNLHENSCELNPLIQKTASFSTDQQTEVHVPDCIFSIKPFDNGFDKEAEDLNTNETRKDETDGPIVQRNGFDIDLMQSVDLNAPLDDLSTCKEYNLQSCSAENQENLWHGTINTSTDTLVPIENKRQCQQQQENALTYNNDENPYDSSTREKLKFNANNSCNLSINSNGNINGINNYITSCDILPKVHNNIRSNTLSNSSSNTSVSSSSSSLNNLHRFSKTVNIDLCDNKETTATTITTTTTAPLLISAQQTIHTFPMLHQSMEDTSFQPISQMYPRYHSQQSMDESILILPEHQKLEISISGKCETVNPLITSVSTTTSNGSATIPNNSPTCSQQSNYPNSVDVSNQKRKRPWSNTRRELLKAQLQTNGGGASTRISFPGPRSSPTTPPSLPERPQITISCPDGLAHALNEQNLRLQQIVHDQKLREDALLRELHDMRMALLKKTCPSCSTNNVPVTNDEQVIAIKASNDEFCFACPLSNAPLLKKYHNPYCESRMQCESLPTNCDDNVCDCYGLDNIENASICSWEAVEDRSGPPSSCTSSSTQPNATSVLWVPDHAVSRCTSCQVEFWIGRRKHHCRSCGQIFCADCSEFLAPLPQEKLLNPVRLCGPCYHSVTTLQNSALMQLQQSATKSAVGTSAVVANVVNMAPAAATSKA